ncbi:hypothetical protein A2G06_16405 (plasmid) [Geobacter anodireducens]|nr:hypothetical protein A2G06_16405 [Geobacter anodireducens]
MYPINVPRRHYNGKEAKRRAKTAEFNRIAAELRVYLNRCIERRSDDIQVYYYNGIASETGNSVDVVRDILFPLECGHYGLTVAKSEEALRRQFQIATTA